MVTRGHQQIAVCAVQWGKGQSLTTDPVQLWQFVGNWAYINLALPSGCRLPVHWQTVVLLNKSQNTSKHQHLNKSNGTNASKLDMS